MALAFAKALQAAIDQAGITPAEFSRRAEVSGGYVYSILAGRFPPTGDEDKLHAWAKALSLDDEGTRQLILAAHLDRAPKLLREEVERLQVALAKRRKKSTKC